MPNHERNQKCSICQKFYAGFGNNAWPVNDGRCCDWCNATVVIPARLTNLAQGELPEGEEPQK